MEGVFVIGTDTGVGKSAICAGLMKLLHGTRKVAFWKPVQTNTITSDDVTDIQTLTGLSKDCFVEPTYRFPDPLAPWLAARKWGKTIELDALEHTFKQKRDEGYFMVIEGAGGLLVPFADKVLQAHLAARLRLPIILVGSDKVGTINHTLLTLHACREMQLDVLGVILTRSRGSLGNAESIVHFGKVEILAEFPPTEDVKTLIAQVGGHERLRNLFQVANLPK